MFVTALAGLRRLASAPAGWAVALAIMAALALLGCSARALVLVDPCPPGGTTAFGSCPPADAAPDGPTASLLLGLVGHWHFDDGPGSTVAHDSSENGNNGALATLDPSTAWVTGHIGPYALETKGLGYASVAWSPNAARSLTIDSIVHQVSLAAWFYLDGPIVDYATPASRQIGGTVFQYYHIGINMQARPSLFVNTTVPGNQLQHPLGPLTDPVLSQKWTHLAGTYDGAMARLYVNGTLVDSKPITGDFGPDTTPFILGGNGNGNMISERFPGVIDEIVLYNRALTDSEIGMLAAGVKF